MMRPLALFIGLRYTRAKRRNHFISFISLASMLGIALGVTVLITVLSVMNGFDYQIRSRFFAIFPQVTILSSTNIEKTRQKLSKKVMTLPEVLNTAPYVSGQGILISGDQVNGVQVLGISPQKEVKVSKLGGAITKGTLQSLQPGKFNMVLGATLAENLGLKIGDKVNLFTPQVNITLVGNFPRYRQFTISGIFHTSEGFGFDTSYAYINIEDATKLFPSGVGVSGLHVKLKNLYMAEPVSLEIQKLLPPGYAVTNWTAQAGAFFQALAMEKTMLFIILLLIVAVAVFNLVSTLVMVVHDKRADIAILRTLGASPTTIMMTFIIQGAIVGLVGTILGLIGGVILSLHITALANAIQNIFHVQLISAKVFFIDYLASRIEVLDVVKVCFAALGLSLLATIYPASIAFRTQPAEALRYE